MNKISWSQVKGNALSGLNQKMTRATVAFENIYAIIIFYEDGSKN